MGFLDEYYYVKFSTGIFPGEKYPVKSHPETSDFQHLSEDNFNNNNNNNNNNNDNNNNNIVIIIIIIIIIINNLKQT